MRTIIIVIIVVLAFPTSTPLVHAIVHIPPYTVILNKVVLLKSPLHDSSILILIKLVIDRAVIRKLLLLERRG